MPGIIFLKLLAVVILVLLNGFFVASELAIVKVRVSQLDALAAPTNRCARLAPHVTSHLDACHIQSGLAKAFDHLALVPPAKRDPVDRLAAHFDGGAPWRWRNAN